MTGQGAERLALLKQSETLFGNSTTGLIPILGAAGHFIRVGVDLVYIPEMAETIEDSGFIERYFTEGERKFCGRKAERYASTFAIKEAVMKVLQAWPKWLTEISVGHKTSGAPVVNLSGSALALKESALLDHLEVSASHEKDYAIGACIGIGRNRFYHLT